MDHIDMHSLLNICTFTMFTLMHISSNEHESIYRGLNFAMLRFWSLKQNSTVVIPNLRKNMNIEKQQK